MAAERVSVIVPVFNRAEMVREAVASSLSQEGVEVEVVVVDDGSTDGSGDVIDELAAGDERVIALHQANAGPSAARNRGVAASSGEWLAFCDSDDMLLPGSLARRLAMLGDAGGPGFVIGLERLELAQGVEVPQIIALRPPREVAPHWNLMTMVLRRSLYDEVGGFDEELRVAEDTDLVARLLKAGHRMHKLEEDVLIRRITGDNLVYGIDVRRSALDIVRRHRPRTTP